MKNFFPSVLALKPRGARIESLEHAAAQIKQVVVNFLGDNYSKSVFG
jgi:hypothetical protein